MEVKEPSVKYLAKSAYKPTQIGLIPEEWEVISIGQIGSFASGSGISIATLSPESSDTPVPVYGGNGIAGFTKHALIQNPTVVIGRVGQQCGQVYLTKGASWITDNALYPKVLHRSVHVPFLARALAAAGLNGLKNHNDLPLVTQSILHAVPIALPSTKVEQQAIAEALSDTDALIEALEQLLAKKRQIKQGAMQELLTGRKRLPGFAGKWDKKRLGDCATLKARIGWQGLTAAEYKEDGEFFLVTGTEFSNGYINWDSCFFVDESRYKQDKNIQLRLHDVLITKDGTIGKIALVNELPLPATLNSGVFVIRPFDKEFDPEFFYHLLCSEIFAGFLVQLSAGSTINHLYQKDFVGFVFHAPDCIAEQTAIATLLSDMDAEISELEAKLTKARGIKQGMMQQLLTGKIRLI
ncbi:restriction endonuclease subunit S [Ralstonia solanacearum]|uniref:Type I restriction modification DNA specificity domain-containing protein n=1 Tax=Ralstonia solanacearum TaxID=305 RepID=A0AAD0S7R0_RALSL|nr:restriction endonuclease subunit S [Ralstonia solanacearum]AXV82303.1 hypothetical protein CJO77_12675 [Ralstonia solanacearum]AXW53430.1 hypothetical protein CJO92_12670 [Ralstonia solanacearum]